MRLGKRWALAWIASVLLLAAAASADVKITREPAAVEHKTFDPAHRPADMPPLKGNEAAVTQSTFECQVGVNYEVVSRKPEGGRCATSIRLEGVRMTIHLKIVIWLPQGSPAKLKAHEEGHRQIDQRVYDGAESIARQIARAIDGQTVTGEADTCDTAEKEATKVAAGKLCRLYIEKVAKPASRISDTYDQITAHGTRAEPAEEEAIRQSFAAEQEESAPATRRGK